MSTQRLDNLEETWPDPSRSAPPHAPAWRLVRFGLGMIFWAVLVFLLSGVAFLVCASVASVDPPKVPTPFASIELFFTCVLLASALVALLGLCLCCGAPPELRVKGLVFVGLIFLVFAIGLALGLLFLYRHPAGRELAFELRQRLGLARHDVDVETLLKMSVALVAIFFFVGNILHMIALRAIAREWRDQPTVDSINFYITCCSALLALNLMAASFDAITNARDPFGIGMAIAGVFDMVCSVILPIWFLRTIAATRTTIAAGARD